MALNYNGFCELKHNTKHYLNAYYNQVVKKLLIHVNRLLSFVYKQILVNYLAEFTVHFLNNNILLSLIISFV